jgi:hypothetical protein
MSVYKKLMQARLCLQGQQLTKSGHNKFAGYYYFELGDFLPVVQKIFSELGLCGIVSFQADVATLRIVDMEDNSEIVITSPMGSAALKGVHEVQNIGAVETYQRRYLWVTAMEIVEHDALDALDNTAGNVGQKPKQAATNAGLKDESNQRSRKQNPGRETQGDTDGLEPDAVIIAQFNAAHTVSDLTRVMNGLPQDQKRLYTGHFNARMQELKKAA